MGDDANFSATVVNNIATAKAEASSNDDETRSPVETLFCVTSKRRLTELRARSAVNADGFVKIE
jgi:hypothetical protein